MITSNEGVLYIDWLYLIISLVVTVIAYMSVPCIYKIVHKGEISDKEAHKVALLNSISVGLIFIIYRSSYGVTGVSSGAPAFLYYYANKWVLLKKDINSKSEDIPKNKDEYQVPVESHKNETQELKLNYCTLCNEVIAEDSKFCVHCGKKVIKDPLFVRFIYNVFPVYIILRLISELYGLTEKFNLLPTRSLYIFLSNFDGILTITSFLVTTISLLITLLFRIRKEAKSFSTSIVFLFLFQYIFSVVRLIYLLINDLENNSSFIATQIGHLTISGILLVSFFYYFKKRDFLELKRYPTLVSNRFIKWLLVSTIIIVTILFFVRIKIDDSNKSDERQRIEYALSNPDTYWSFEFSSPNRDSSYSAETYIDSSGKEEMCVLVGVTANKDMNSEYFISNEFDKGVIKVNYNDFSLNGTKPVDILSYGLKPTCEGIMEKYNITVKPNLEFYEGTVHYILFKLNQFSIGDQNLKYKDHEIVHLSGLFD